MLIAAAAVAWATPYDLTVKWGVMIGAAIYVCLQASDFLISVFQSVLKQGRNAVAEVAGALATLIVVWALATLTHAGAIPMLGATLLGAVLAVGISWRLAHRLVPFRLSFDLPLWRRFLVAGLPIAGAQILGMAMLRATPCCYRSISQPPMSGCTVCPQSSSRLPPRFPTSLPGS